DGLQKAQPAAEELVVGKLVFRETHCDGSTPLSRQIARAMNRSRSATISRCGRKPREPSRMLMWTSKAKEAIPSPSRRACAKAITVGSVVRKSSFMTMELALPAPRGKAEGAMVGMDAMPDKPKAGPQDRLAAHLAEDMAAVNALIRARMASEHAPRIPEVTAHLIEAGGKRLRPMLTLAAARLCGYAGTDHRKLAATVEFIHTATLL